MQISKTSNIEHLEKFGHFRYRKDVAHYFAGNQQGDISYDQLFVEAKTFAKKKSIFCSTPEAKKKFEICRGNVVFIAGQAGIGKSTFSKLLVKQMLDSENPLFGAEVVIYVKLRNINYKKEMNFLQFFTNGNRVDDEYSDCEQKIIIKKLFELGEKVFIVMDGFDEAVIKNTTCHSACRMEEKERPEVLILSLINGDFLPQSKKIITSRPRQLTRLPDNFHSYFIVNILGLDDNGQAQICSNLCKNDSKQRDKILHFINSHPDLKSFCYVPINAILTMRILFETAASDWSNLNSLTAIIVTALNVWFLNDGKVIFQAKEIALLAYTGFIENRYYFELDDFEKAGVNFQNSTTFLTSYSKYRLLEGTETISYFAHLMWQEFFVALKLRLYTSTDTFKQVLSKLSSDKYEVVTRFLFGLCNNGILKKLLKHVKAEGLSSKRDREKCSEVLRKFSSNALKTAGSDFTYENFPFSLRKKVTNYCKKLQPTLGLIYEMRESSYTKQAAAFLTNNIFINIESKNQISLIFGFNYILRHRESRLDLDVVIAAKNCSTLLNHFLGEMRFTTLKNSNIKVSIVKL